MYYRWSSVLCSQEIETPSRLIADEALLRHCEASSPVTKGHRLSFGILLTRIYNYEAWIYNLGFTRIYQYLKWDPRLWEDKIGRNFESESEWDSTPTTSVVMLAKRKMRPPAKDVALWRSCDGSGVLSGFIALLGNLGQRRWLDLVCEGGNRFFFKEEQACDGHDDEGANGDTFRILKIPIML